jgi:hypothetical protein
MPANLMVYCARASNSIQNLKWQKSHVKTAATAARKPLKCWIKSYFFAKFVNWRLVLNDDKIRNKPSPMKLATHIKPVIFGVFAMVLLVGLNSCNKQNDTIATVKVVKIIDGASVHNAKVTVDPNNEVLEHKPGIEKEAMTNSSGEATFNYNELYNRGTAGLFVLEVRVEATIDGVPTVVEGIIEVEQETTSETIIEM